MKGSKLWFRLFLWLSSTSIVVILLHSVDLIVFSESGGQVEWIKWTMYLIGLVTTFFMTMEKTQLVIKVLLGLISAYVIIAVGKFARYFGFNVPVILLIDNVTLVFMTAILYLLTVMFQLLFYNKFKFMYRLLTEEAKLPSKDSYITWLKEENVENTEKKLSAYVKSTMNIGIVLLILILVGLIIEPEGKTIHSIAFMFFFLSGLGMYLILYQFKKLLDSKVNGEILPSDQIVRWNRMIGLFFVPVIVISLAVPWYYKVFDISEVSNYVNDKMSGVEIKLDTQEETDKPDTSSIPTSSTEEDIESKPEPIPQDTDETIPQQDKETEKYPLTIRITFYILIVLAGLYLILGIIGAILYRKLRYAKQTWFIRFLISRYKSLKGLLDTVASFFKVIFSFIGGIFGLHSFQHKVKDNELASPVAQQLFSLFKVNEEMSDEKKEEIRTIVKDFVRMIEILGRYVTPYRFYYGPQEYIRRVAKQIPELKKILFKVVAIFNESRYSLHNLSDVKIGNFQGGVNFIIEKISEPGFRPQQAEEY